MDEKKIWNANGLRNKKEWLETAIDREEQAPAVVLIQESHIPTEQFPPHIQGFDVKHRGPSTREGGVLIYYRAILPASEAPPTPKDRITAIIIDSVAIINVYAPVNCTEETEREEFYHQLAAYASSIRATVTSVIIAGDFNAQIAG